MTLIVEVVFGPGQGMKLTLGPGDRIQIGRSHDMQLRVVEDRRMSRRHASIGYDGHTCEVRDLNSSNGTFVNSVRVPTGQAIRAAHGDLVKLGDSVLLLQTAQVEQVFGDSTRVLDTSSPGGNIPGPVIPADVALDEEIDFAERTMKTRPGEDIHAYRQRSGFSPQQTGNRTRQCPEPVIINTTSFPVSYLYWQNERHTAQLIMIVKASYSIGENGEITVANQQSPLSQTELAKPDGPYTEIVLATTDCVSDDLPATTSDITVRVGSLDHVIHAQDHHRWILPPGTLLKSGEIVEISQASSKHELAFHLPEPPRFWLRSLHALNDSRSGGYIGKRGTVTLETLIVVPKASLFHAIYRAVFDLSGQDSGTSPEVVIL